MFCVSAGFSSGRASRYNWINPSLNRVELDADRSGGAKVNNSLRIFPQLNLAE